MEKINTKKEEKEEIKYLQEGKQTKITPQIKNIASNIDNRTKKFDEKIKEICIFLKTLKRNKENKNEIFRKRTADEIISSGFVTGCTDEALIFIALARSMNIPTKYIETIDLNTLKEINSNSYMGHVYCGVFGKDKKWKVVNQTNMQIDVDISKDGRVIFGEGLDSWDIGIKDFDSWKQKFNDFRNLTKSSK